MKSTVRGTAAAALSVILAACGSASAPDPLPIAGDYKLCELYDDSGASLNEELAELNAAGETVTLHLAEDGTGTYTIFGDPEEVTWTESSLTFEGETMDLAWTENSLTVYSGGGTDGRMVFAPAGS